MKTPGPDGFATIFFFFYQQNWATVGLEVCKDVLNIYNSGFMNKALNSTYIALISKTKNPSYVNEFRPISLCNVHCKMFQKSL
jgi:hypothetical protein